MLFIFLILLILNFLIFIFLIPYLKKIKFGQSIRKEGPKTHYSKSGTPTMGGIGIIIGTLINFIVLIGYFHKRKLIIFNQSESDTTEAPQQQQQQSLLYPKASSLRLIFKKYLD